MNRHRCETCKKPHRVPNGLSRFPIFECCGEEMPFDTAISTGMRGCASHSDFQSEREKMLDEVRMRLSKLKTAYPRGTGADFVWWLVIDTVLKELRRVVNREPIPM